MKKFRSIVSVVLAMLMLLSLTGVFAYAENEGVSMEAGTEALNAQFQKGVGPKTNGYAIDYRYFEPVNADNGKYPLVVWLHGMSEGGSEGMQIERNNIGYWTSTEFQSRFEGSEGAYILAARSLEEKGLFWSDSLIEPLRAAIDDFVANHNVDTTRIYIGGFSMGGKMTLKMAVAYPEMFAAAFPICPAWEPSDAQAAYLADMPIWLTSGTLDPLVNYNLSVKPLWKKITANSNIPENCRFSTLSKVCYPDGKRTTSSHHAWFSVNNDMFSVDNGDYPYMTTVDGAGNKVVLTYPNGMISWLSGFSSDYDGTPIEGTGNITPEDQSAGSGILAMIMNYVKKIINFISSFFSSFGK